MLAEKVLYYSKEEREKIESQEIPSEELLKNYIEELKKWLEKQPHLPQNEEPLWLRTILVLTKFNLEKAKKKLESLYTVRSLYPTFFERRDPLNPGIQNVMKAVMVCPLPRLNDDLCRVHCFKFLPETDLFDNEWYAKYIFLTVDIRCGYFEELTVGEHFIIDYSTAKMSHILKTNPFLIRSALYIIKNAYAERVKGLHLINIPPFANNTITLILSLLSEKLRKRIHVHKDVESLQKIISPRILPLEYGGEEKSLDVLNGNWIKFLESASDWFKVQESRKSNESLRPTWAPLDPDMYGAEGSFRKLEFD